MKIYVKIFTFVVISLFCLNVYSKSSKTPKPEKIIKDAVNKTLKQRKLNYRITIGKTSRIVWDGYTKDKKLCFLGTGIIADDKTGKVDNSSKKRVYFDGKKYLMETSSDSWELAKSSKIRNLGAQFIKGDVIKKPLDIFSLIKKFSLDEYSYKKESKKDADDSKNVKDINDKKPAVSDLIQIIARKESKKPAVFIEYSTYRKKLKEEEHWKDSKISDCMVETIFTINKKTSLIKKINFKYEVGFLCNYGKGDDRCLGCIDDIGDEIVLEFIDDSNFKLELPESLKRKLGIKDVAEAQGGLKLTLSVNKNRINKGESLEFEVKWENVIKKELKIKRMLKTNPYIVFEIEGELKSSTERFKNNMQKRKQLLDEKPFKLKAGETHREVFIMESDGFISDDLETKQFKTGKFYIKVKTKIFEGEYVESNTVELEILP